MRHIVKFLPLGQRISDELETFFFQFLECAEGLAVVMLFKKLDHVIDMGMQEKKLVGGTGFASLALLQALLEPVPEGISFLRVVDVPAQVLKDGRDIAFEIDVQEAYIPIWRRSATRFRRW